MIKEVFKYWLEIYKGREFYKREIMNWLIFGNGYSMRVYRLFGF